MTNSSNFGYKKVNSKEKTKLVQKVFSDVAQNYDLMNEIMSLGTHKLWKKKFINIVDPKNNEKIIDVGSGSGDLVEEILKRKFNGLIDIVDLNKNMLNLGKVKIKNKNVKFHLQNAEALKFKNNRFDKYLISFCLRNISDIEKSLKEALRVLKPGGSFYCLEFSKPSSFIVSKIYSKYKSTFIPLAGRFISNNKEAYNYLSESIDLFPNQEELKIKIMNSGFTNVSYINLFNGIVSIHKASKI